MHSYSPMGIRERLVDHVQIGLISNSKEINASARTDTNSIKDTVDPSSPINNLMLILTSMEVIPLFLFQLKRIMHSFLFNNQ